MDSRLVEVAATDAPREPARRLHGGQDAAARLQEELDVSYVLITHDLATVRAIADAVVVMREGVIVEQGQKDAVLDRPSHPYTRLLLSSVPQMDPAWLDRTLRERLTEA